jgi:hypothetical protein
LLNLQSRFSKYFPEAVSDKYKLIKDQFHVVSPQNYEFSLSLSLSLSLEEESYIGIISATFSKVQLPRKSYMEFWMGIGG